MANKRSQQYLLDVAAEIASTTAYEAGSISYIPSKVYKFKPAYPVGLFTVVNKPRGWIGLHPKTR